MAYNAHPLRAKPLRPAEAKSVTNAIITFSKESSLTISYHAICVDIHVDVDFTRVFGLKTYSVNDYTNIHT